MFGRKKRSWSWAALGSLIVSGIIFGIARFFLRAAEKESLRFLNKKKVKTGHHQKDELFI
jgi:hypothetical protein